MTEYRLNAEIFTRLTRLFLGVNQWVFDLVIYPNRYYLVVSTEDESNYASFEVEEMQFDPSVNCLITRVSSNFINTFSSLPIKKLAGDIVFKPHTQDISVTYDNNEYVERFNYTLVKLAKLDKLTPTETLDIFSNLLEVLKVSNSYLTSLQISRGNLVGWNEDKTLVVLHEQIVDSLFNYQLGEPRFFYSLYSKVNSSSPLLLNSNELGFNFTIKLSSKELIPVKTKYAGFVEFNNAMYDSIIYVLSNVTVNGRKLDITLEKIKDKSEYISQATKNKEIKANDLVKITNEYKLGTQDFFRIFKGALEVVKAKLCYTTLYVRTDTISFLTSLYFEVLAEADAIADDMI